MNRCLITKNSSNLITHHDEQENGDSVGWVKFHFHHLSLDATKNNTKPAHLKCSRLINM